MDAMVPIVAAHTTMVPVAVAKQQLLGDDDDREAQQLALQRDAETRLALRCTWYVMSLSH